MISSQNDECMHVQWLVSPSLSTIMFHMKYLTKFDVLYCNYSENI